MLKSEPDLQTNVKPLTGPIARLKTGDIKLKTAYFGGDFGTVFNPTKT